MCVLATLLGSPVYHLSVPLFFATWTTWICLPFAYWIYIYFLLKTSVLPAYCLCFGNFVHFWGWYRGLNANFHPEDPGSSPHVSLTGDKSNMLLQQQKKQYAQSTAEEYLNSSWISWWKDYNVIDESFSWSVISLWDADVYTVDIGIQTQ